MKKHLIFLLTILLIGFLSDLTSYAQAPEKFTYQAEARDSHGTFIRNARLEVKITILAGSLTGTIVWEGTHKINTDKYGLFTLIIGEGTGGSYNFSDIEWANNSHFLNVQVRNIRGNRPDIGNRHNNQGNWMDMGTTQFLSVPYALHANTVGSITETDPVFGTSVASEISETDITNWNNKLDTEIDGSITNEIQTLSISEGTIYLSDGGSVKLPFGPFEAEEGDLITFDGTNWVAKSAITANTGGSQEQNNMQPWIGINHIIALQGIYPSRNGAADPALAEIIMFAGNFAPRGWALCDGQLLAISSNSALFSLLGTTFGGDGRTTFALPDMRGRTAIHPGTGPGLSPRHLGGRGGTETNTMTISQMPSHNHTITYQ